MVHQCIRLGQCLIDVNIQTFEGMKITQEVMWSLFYSFFLFSAQWGRTFCVNRIQSIWNIPPLNLLFPGSSYFLAGLWKQCGPWWPRIMKGCFKNSNAFWNCVGVGEIFNEINLFFGILGNLMPVVSFLTSSWITEEIWVLWTRILVTKTNPNKYKIPPVLILHVLKQLNLHWKCHVFNIQYF